MEKIDNIDKYFYEQFKKFSLPSKNPKYMNIINFSYISSLSYNMLHNDKYTVPAIISTFLSYVIATIIANNVNTTPGINKLRKLYEEYTKSISKLNTELEIDDDIIKMHELFIYLYNYGYLSCDKKFNIEVPNDVDPNRLGIDVVSGQGVCRNLCSLFKDVLSNNNHKADIIRLNLLEYDSENFLKLVYLLMNEITEKSKIEELSKIINNSPVFKKEGILQTTFGNHAIVGTNYDDKYLLLDPLNNTYWFLVSPESFIYEGIKSEVDNWKNYLVNTPNNIIFTNLYNSDYSIYKGTIQTRPFNDTFGKMDKNANIEKKVGRLFDDRNSIYQKRNEVDLLISNNIDLFEKFYEDNMDLYRDIKSRTLKLRSQKNEKNQK